MTFRERMAGLPTADGTIRRPMPDLIPWGRAGFAMDLVALAMLAVLPLQAYSIALVKRGQYSAHRRWQIALSAALLVTVVLFEIDVRLHGWRHQAKDSPWYPGVVMPLLWVHIAIASLTFVLVLVTLSHGLRRFGRTPRPGPASRHHRRLGWATVLGLVLTSLTGWAFYALAFLC
jgi:putative membrane protein